MTLWEYRCQVERIIDGDTLELFVDKGFSDYSLITVRLSNLDTAEIYGRKKESEEYRQGQIHKEFVESWVDQHDDEEWSFIVKTEKDRTGKYGRYLAELHAGSSNLNKELIERFPEVERT